MPECQPRYVCWIEYMSAIRIIFAWNISKICLRIYYHMPEKYIICISDKPKISLDSVRYGWYIPKICLRYFWDTPDLCLIYAYYLPEISLIYAWEMLEIGWNMPEIICNMPDTYRRYTGQISEIYMRYDKIYQIYAWYLLEKCPYHTKYIPAIYLRYPWDMPEIYLTYTWCIPEIYLIKLTWDIPKML